MPIDQLVLPLGGRQTRVIIAGCRPPKRAPAKGAPVPDLPMLRVVMRYARDNRVFRRPTLIVSGCARGVDQLGERWAELHDIPVAQYPADWRRHGNAAGPRRNAVMAQNADALVALWDGRSAGTGHMIETAFQHRLLVLCYRFDIDRFIVADDLAGFRLGSP